MLGPDEKRSLQGSLPEDQVLTGPAQLAAYQYDAGLEPGHPQAVILAQSSVDLQAIAQWGSQRGLSMTARGAGTGYTGGSVASHGGLMVSFARMNKILELDAECRIAVVEPGVSNENLQRSLQPLGLFYPPDPASLSVC